MQTISIGQKLSHIHQRCKFDSSFSCGIYNGSNNKQIISEYFSSTFTLL